MESDDMKGKKQQQHGLAHGEGEYMQTEGVVR